jgi:glycosyltransferase involved in cell wall biosynthesis
VGGVEELTRQLALEQTRHGMQPLIVTNQWPRDLPDTDMVDQLPVRRLPFRVPGPHARQLIGWATQGRTTHRQTERLLQQWRADLVHVQCVSSNAPFARKASRRLDLPLVVSTQGELSMDANHTFERSTLARSMLRRALDDADIITGCSQYVVRELDRFSEGRHGAKMRVIYNGIDLEECARATPESRSRPYILGLGRLVPQKGYDILIRAFDQLASEYPDHELVIAGDGPQSKQLHRLVMNHNLQARVHLLGTVDHQRALSLMAGAAAFSLCSRHEPQGIVLLEAMAAGAPVVASAVGGVPEIVDGTNGFLFPTDDDGALAHRLREVLGDDATASGLRRGGRMTAARFSWSVLAAEYQTAYVDAGA